MLKTVIAAAALSLLAIVPAHAKSGSQHTPSAAQMAQRQRMKDCNVKAKSDHLKGAQRRAFMKQCLSKAGHDAAMAGKARAAAVSDKRTAQREKMKSCNAQARTDKLKGAKRKAFMKQCLSK